MTAPHFTHGPLNPYTIMDLSNERGYLCGRILADLGANVIKIEPPEGDPGRKEAPYHDWEGPGERQMAWRAFNANKRGVTLNIEREKGQELLKRLVQRVDFLIESFEPGYLTSLGLNYRNLSALNPMLIMVSITAFGQEGPYAHYQASDVVLQAMGGFMYVTGQKEGSPVRISVPTAWLHAGAEGAVGALIALYHRTLTGEGQHIDVSAQQCVVWTLMNSTQTWDLTRRNMRRSGNIYEEPDPPRSRPHHWPCKDGQVSYTNYGGPLFAKSSPRLYRLIEEMDGVNVDHLLSKKWLSPEGSKTDVSQQDLDDEAEILGPFFLRHTKEELYRWALEHRFMLTPVYTPEELLKDHQIMAREYMTDVDWVGAGKIVALPGAFARMTETPLSLSRPVPMVGEHNEEVYIKELGLSREEYRQLQHEGVI